MADNAPNRNNQPPPPLATIDSTSNANVPFTPRSSSFPDGLDSDSDLDAFVPTPTHSPGGPQYDELPPSYDEAQQQALQDARAGVPPLDPNDLEVRNLVLDDNLAAPSPASPPLSSRSPGNPNAYELEQDSRRNGSGHGTDIPMYQVHASEQILVGRMPTGASAPVLDMLLSQALEFAHHEPDTDARYAPRLMRPVAIPQQNARVSSEDETSRRGRRGRRGRERRDGRREGPQFTGQWRGSSNDTANAGIDPTHEPVQFLRAYAKALHAHSIRPAEFTEFLDGLNTLCIATGSTANHLVQRGMDSNVEPSLVHNYIDSANEIFFAPRGLRVSLQSLYTLLDALNIPNERGQRSGAVVSALDDHLTAPQKAQALHPWAEQLESDVPSMSTQSLVVKEMSERLRHQPQNSPIYDQEAPSGGDHKVNSEKQDDDPPHSVPELPPGPDSTSPWPWGNGNAGAGRPFGPFEMPGAWPPGASGRGPFSQHRERGRGRWGNHRGPGAPPSPFGLQGFPSAPRGFGPGTNANTLGNEWAAWGEGIAKWGEDFGKRMEKWGQQVGQDAARGGPGAWRGGPGRGAEPWAPRGPFGWNQQAAQGPGAQSQGLDRGGQESGGQESGVYGSANTTRTHQSQEGKRDNYDDNDDDDSSSNSDSSDSDSDTDANANANANAHFVAAATAPSKGKERKLEKKECKRGLRREKKDLKREEKEWGRSLEAAGLQGEERRVEMERVKEVFGGRRREVKGRWRERRERRREERRERRVGVRVCVMVGMGRGWCGLWLRIWIS